MFCTRVGMCMYVYALLVLQSYDDFLKYFVRVVVCRLATSRGDPWSEHRMKGAFHRTVTGATRKPQHLVRTLCGRASRM